VTVTSKDGVFLGTTQFTYVDHKKDILKQMVQSKKLQGEFFIMLGRQCENDESEENNTRGFGKVKCLSFIGHVSIWLSLKPHYYYYYYYYYYN